MRNTTHLWRPPESGPDAGPDPEPDEDVDAGSGSVIVLALYRAQRRSATRTYVVRVGGERVEVLAAALAARAGVELDRDVLVVRGLEPDLRHDEQVGELVAVGVDQRVGRRVAQRDPRVGRLVAGGAERLERAVDPLAPGPQLVELEQHVDRLGVVGRGRELREVHAVRIAGAARHVAPDVLGGEAQDRRRERGQRAQAL